jgi:PKD repeat protein
VNQPPAAAFTSSTAQLTATVDGSTSTDADGTVASYAWAFGDGGTGAGATASHAYAAAGTYTVSLTVTDDDGATATTTHPVTVTAPAGPAVLARDTFGRTVTGGLGTADVGGAWTAAAGAARQSVTPGVAELRLDAANQNTGSYLGSVAQTGADIRTTVTATAAPTGNGTYVYVTGRRVQGAGEYRVRVRLLADGRVGLALSRLTGTTESFPGGELVMTGLTYTPGTALNVHVQVFGTGTTQVRATVWAAGTTEPATPTISRTDTTAALQAPGGVGLAAHRPSGTTAATAVRFGSLTITEAG